VPEGTDRDASIPLAVPLRQVDAEPVREGATALAFDLLDEPIVRGFIVAAAVALLLSIVFLVRAWRAEWRSPLWDDDDTSFEPFDERATAGGDDDRSGWEIVRDILEGFVDLDGN
jgi:hypothetical protein